MSRACAADCGLTDRHDEIVGRKLFLDPAIEKFVFEINDRIGIANGGLDQSLRVVCRRRANHFQAGRVHEIHFRILRMERAAVNAAAARSANHDGNAGAPAIAAFRGEVRDLIEGAGNEIGELHFGDGPHSHQRRADRRADDSGFGDRRVDDAPLAESLEHAGGDFESAAVDADIFAKDEDAFVLFHLFPDALANRFDVSS